MQKLHKYSDLKVSMTILNNGDGILLGSTISSWIQTQEPKDKYEVVGSDFSFSIETSMAVKDVDQLLEMMIDKLKSIKH